MSSSHRLWRQGNASASSSSSSSSRQSSASRPPSTSSHRAEPVVFGLSESGGSSRSAGYSSSRSSSSRGSRRSPPVVSAGPSQPSLAPYPPNSEIEREYNVYKYHQRSAGTAGREYYKNSERLLASPDRAGPYMGREYGLQHNYNLQEHQDLHPLSRSARDHSRTEARLRNAFNEKHKDFCIERGQYEGHVTAANNAVTSSRNWKTISNAHLLSRDYLNEDIATLPRASSSSSEGGYYR